MTSRIINDRVGCELFFKCENFQRVGAFKFRGAMNAVLLLTEAEAVRGVVTHSSGNHAQAVALAARIRGIPAHIVMPTDAPLVKKRAVEGYGARIIPCAPNVTAREETAAAVVAETGGTLIPPYDHPDVIAGQGTAALELLEEIPGLDAILAPVGGGGLLAGTTLCARELRPGIRVFAAEPAGADDAARSRAAGRLIPQTGPNTIADGLRTSLGQHTWPIVRDLIEDVLVVPEAEIVPAMELVFTRMKLVIEPSSAVPLAAILGGQLPAGISRVGIILSGGNVDLNVFWRSFQTS